MTDKIPPETLKAISHHLWYEISTLEAQLYASSSEQPIRNALVEARVIHIRNLIDFFYPVSHRREGDVFASDFFDPKRWDTIRPEITEHLKKARRRAHKEISHITLDRLEVTPEAKAWPFDEIANDLLNIVRIFLEYVDRGFISEDWYLDLPENIDIAGSNALFGS